MVGFRVTLICVVAWISACNGETGMEDAAVDADAMTSEVDGGSTEVDGGSTDLDGGSTDLDGGSTVDGGSTEVDGGSSDMDGGSTDADAGPRDAGSGDAGSGDAGAMDAGAVDAGLGDAGYDAAISDEGGADAGFAFPTAAGTYEVAHEITPPASLPPELVPARAALEELLDEPGSGLLRLLAIADAGDSYATAPPWDSLFAVCAAPGDPHAGCGAAGEVALTALGETAATSVEAVADDAVAASAGGFTSIGDAFANGGDVLDGPYALTGTLTLTEDPDASGLLGNTSSMALNQVTWRPSGGDVTVNLASGAIIRAVNIEPWLVTDGVVGLAMHVAELALSSRYHELWILALEAVILPRIDVSVTSLSALFTRMDCDDLHTRLAIDTPSSVADAVEASCHVLRASSGGVIEDWMRAAAPALDAYLFLATAPDAPCPVQAMGAPPAISSIGSPTDACAWEATLRADSGGSEAVTSTWWAQPL